MKRTPLRLIEQASFHPFYIQSLLLFIDLHRLSTGLLICVRAQTLDLHQNSAPFMKKAI